STCGSGDTGSRKYAIPPASAIAQVSSVVPTGRLMNGDERLIRFSNQTPPLSVLAKRRIRVFGVPQTRRLLGHFDHDAISGASVSSGARFHPATRLAIRSNAR